MLLHLGMQAGSSQHGSPGINMQKVRFGQVVLQVGGPPVMSSRWTAEAVVTLHRADSIQEGGLMRRLALPGCVSPVACRERSSMGAQVSLGQRASSGRAGCRRPPGAACPVPRASWIN